jgi:hypothetical protein
MSIVEGQIYVARIGKKWGLKGFTPKDMRTLAKLAREKYKIKTKRSRIIKKYVRQLIVDALRNQFRSA